MKADSCLDDWRPRAAALVATLSTEEQALLLSGNGWWDTHAIERVGLPSIKLSDGPHGLRKAQPGQSESTGGSLPATCFPTASAMAATWNPRLVGEIGRTLALEAQAAGVHVLLGPGVNIKRSPLGGRNFEYFSEDPCLAGRLAVAYIQGVQDEGVGTSLKHFAANSQETERMVSDSQIDERTLHEIYLPAFEMAVREAQPWTVMSAYNLVNGHLCSEHHELLGDILRQAWGFRGLVVSDWGGISDRIAAAAAGCSLEMPGSGDYNRRRLVEAVQTGRLAPEALAAAATDIVRVVLMAHAQHRPGGVVDVDAHHAVARQVAGEAIVLLRNEQGVLPLAQGQRVAVIGRFAREPRYQGVGSSNVQPYRLTNAYDELALQIGGGALAWAEGFGANGEATEAQLEEAVALAARCDVALVFAGPQDRIESEALDRRDIHMPASQNRLIEAVAAAQLRTVVVLHNGAAVAMPWVDRVQGIVEAWLGGQAGGAAVADVLTGRVNPSGKLAETFPMRLEDTAAHPEFPARGRVARYGEGLFVGYRHQDARAIEPLYPFGFGLSYTRFTLLALRAAKASFDARVDTALQVEVDVTNEGDVAGSEVVQLYLHARTPRLVRPPQELRAFEKVALDPGQTRTVQLQLGRRDFAHWDPTLHAWRVDSGSFELRVGNSSRHLPLTLTVQVQGDAAEHLALTRQSLAGELLALPGGEPLYRQVVCALGFDSLVFDEAGPTAGEQGAKRRTRRTAVIAITNAMPLGKVPALSQGRLDDQTLDEILRKASRVGPAAS